jgi:hypothetical protein
MIIGVWEVYKKDSQECVMFLTRELAESQTVFDEVDLITESNVDLSNKDIAELNNGNAVY